jgi:hypothetical protein
MKGVTMWKKEKFSEEIHSEICDYINEFLEESNRLREIKEEEIMELHEFYNNDIKEYIKIHALIEDRFDEIESIINNRGLLDYCGKNIKQVIELLGIESEFINEDTNFQEMDNLLSVIDTQVKHLKKKYIRKNNWNFLVAMTLLDNYLVNSVRLLYNEHSLLSKEKQNEKLIQFGKNSLINQVKWFTQINPKLEYPNDKLIIYNAKRNTIVHSASIISEKIIEHIPFDLQEKYNFKRGLKVEIKDDELLEVFDDIINLAKNIFHSITQKFCMSLAERGIGTSNEELRNHIKNEVLKIKVSEWD